MTISALIIDDSLVIRAILENVIGNHSDLAIVGIASDVETARRMIDDHQPDVITLDLALPGMDGLSFLGELSSRPHAPVIVVSSSTVAESAAAKNAVDRGAYACFDKAKLVSESDKFIRLLKKAAKQRSKAA
ncbi:MAG TPA: response regulator [Sphingomonas sp.]|nr:response regulator [Sphingomonas sp.]